MGDLRCAGAKEAAGSLDTLGLIARSVEDIALSRAVLPEVQPEPIAGETGAAHRLCGTHIWEQCEPATRELLELCPKKLAASQARTRKRAGHLCGDRHRSSLDHSQRISPDADQSAYMAESRSGSRA
ncbi:MAG TPA: hypothetical protein VGQ88_00595 [Burkholderiales bacterium]|nr:hypothetical protein [Burkholderiales bacterium]